MNPEKPRRMPDYRLEQMDHELLLFHPAQSTILYCNETSTLIWNLCDGSRSVEEITELLKAAYPESAEAIPADVRATLNQFHAHSAIEFV
jgi:hypothetical protein